MKHLRTYGALASPSGLTYSYSDVNNKKTSTLHMVYKPNMFMSTFRH